MSIYATLWTLKFPKEGTYFPDEEWIEVMAQGVPAHIGSPMPGNGYEDGDPYASFLPPALRVPFDYDGTELRAVVFVRPGSPKGTSRSGQEYVSPLLVLTGAEYEAMPFPVLHARLATALREQVPDSGE